MIGICDEITVDNTGVF